jgi:hypothetical protein
MVLVRRAAVLVRRQVVAAQGRRATASGASAGAGEVGDGVGGERGAGEAGDGVRGERDDIGASFTGLRRGKSVPKVFQAAPKSDFQALAYGGLLLQGSSGFSPCRVVSFLPKKKGGW